RADTDMMCRAGVRLTDRQGPVHNPETFETNVPGLFVAGGAVAGIDTGTTFIENGRVPGGKIHEMIAQRLLLKDPLVLDPAGGAPPTASTIDVTVHEGTSMSVAVSPDGRTLAIDLQGSIWTLPAAGGAATRITDLFNDARQPTWSPDGKWITFFGYRDGGYDIWAIAPDGSNQLRLTWGPFDDREPIWSHDGTRIAFSSDRGDPLGSDYNIWTLDIRDGEVKQ